MRARFAGRCACGADVAPGDEIRWDIVDRRITGCEDCDFTGERRQVADTRAIRGGMRAVGASLRRRREKEAKRRAREASATR